MSFLWLTAVIAVLVAAFFILTLILSVRYMRGVKGDRPVRPREAGDNSVDIAVYAYDSGINGLDDIKARHIGVYRDTGVITGIEDDCRVYRESFTRTKDNERELGLIVRSAAEVKRVTDKTVIYYFKRIRPLKIRSGNIRVLYECISRGLDDDRPVVLSMTRAAAGDNEL